MRSELLGRRDVQPVLTVFRNAGEPFKRVAADCVLRVRFIHRAFYIRCVRVKSAQDRGREGLKLCSFERSNGFRDCIVERRGRVVVESLVIGVDLSGQSVVLRDPVVASPE